MPGSYLNLSCHFILLEFWRFYLRGHVDRTAASSGNKEVHSVFLLRSLFTVLRFPSTLMGNYAVCYSSSIDSQGTGSVLGGGCTCKRTRLLEHWWFLLLLLHGGLLPPPLSSSYVENSDCVLWEGGPEQAVSFNFFYWLWHYLCHSWPILLSHTHSSHCTKK